MFKMKFGHLDLFGLILSNDIGDRDKNRLIIDADNCTHQQFTHVSEHYHLCGSVLRRSCGHETALVTNQVIGYLNYFKVALSLYKKIKNYVPQVKLISRVAEVSY